MDEHFVVSIGLGRQGGAMIELGEECDRCHIETRVLCVDGSDGEYDCVRLCLFCIIQMFGDADG